PLAVSHELAPEQLTSSLLQAHGSLLGLDVTIAMLVRIATFNTASGAALDRASSTLKDDYGSFNRTTIGMTIRRGDPAPSAPLYDVCAVTTALSIRPRSKLVSLKNAVTTMT